MDKDGGPICGQQTCDESATHRVFWPGRDPINACLNCADKAKGISAAMGFHLVVEPLAEREKQRGGE
jgi:hypothetical protein